MDRGGSGLGSGSGSVVLTSGVVVEFVLFDELSGIGAGAVASVVLSGGGGGCVNPGMISRQAATQAIQVA